MVKPENGSGASSIRTRSIWIESTSSLRDSIDIGGPTANVRQVLNRDEDDLLHQSLSGRLNDK